MTNSHFQVPEVPSNSGSRSTGGHNDPGKLLIYLFLFVDMTRLNFQVAKVQVDNQWITELRDQWSKPPFSFLPRAEDGLQLLEALERYPSPIPKYDTFLP